MKEKKRKIKKSFVFKVSKLAIAKKSCETINVSNLKLAKKSKKVLKIE
jgi:hypothetical protein